MYISRQARQDIDHIWQRGFDDFGLRIANDYDLLIEQALHDLMDDPHRNGSKQIAGHKEDILAYPILYSKPRAQGDIKHPRHAVYYYLIEERIVAIASITRQVREEHINALRRAVIMKELQENKE